MTENINTISEGGSMDATPEEIENLEKLYPYGELICVNPNRNYYILHVTSEGIEKTFNIAKMTGGSGHWSILGSGSYYKLTKRSSIELTIKIDPNDTCERRANNVFITSSPEGTIEIVQEAGYNRLHKILPSKQITSTGCATTCVGMCVFKTPQEMKDDGVNLNYVESWSQLAGDYGYTCEDCSSPSLEAVYNYLAEGLPVTVQINTGSKMHWVVIYAYFGNGKHFYASDFMCADPAPSMEQTLSLDKAWGYSHVSVAKVFKKK